MGIKEENLPTRIVFGFAGQSRPEQVIGGACIACNLEVWINPQITKESSIMKYLHYSCGGHATHT